jgi:hypothetical protein
VSPAKIDTTLEECDVQLRALAGGVEGSLLRRACGVGEDASLTVNDDDSLVSFPFGARDDALDPSGVAPRNRIGDLRGNHRCAAEDARLELCVGPALDVQTQRNLERDYDDRQEIRRREDEPSAEAHDPSSSAEAKRNPTPLTVWM